MSTGPIFNAELHRLRSKGFQLVTEQERPTVIRSTNGRQRSTRITAAADHYRRELAKLPEQTRSARWGVLRSICRQLGVRPSAVCNRLKREPAP